MTRRIFGYGVAAAVTPYLIVKVVWVVGALLGVLPPSANMSTGAFVALNLVTIGMAAAGVRLGLALGRADVRGTGRPILVFAWVACGFLVPMIPYLVRGFVTSHGADFEHSLIQGSFLALACCLVVAVPLYLAERRPSAYAGRPRPPLMLAAMIGALAVGLICCYWCAGGDLGLAHPQQRDADWRLLAANTGLWAFAGAWAVSRPGRLAAAVAWLSSGLLFAWSAWKLPFTLVLALGADPTVIWPENLAVAAVVDLLGVAAGLAMVTTLVSRADADGARPAPVARQESPA